MEPKCGPYCLISLLPSGQRPTALRFASVAGRSANLLAQRSSPSLNCRYSSRLRSISDNRQFCDTIAHERFQNPADDAENRRSNDPAEREKDNSEPCGLRMPLAIRRSGRSRLPLLRQGDDGPKHLLRLPYASGIPASSAASDFLSAERRLHVAWASSVSARPMRLQRGQQARRRMPRTTAAVDWHASTAALVRPANRSVLAFLDTVLHLAARAVDVLVELAGIAIRPMQRGDEEARVGLILASIRPWRSPCAASPSRRAYPNPPGLRSGVPPAPSGGCRGGPTPARG